MAHADSAACQHILEQRPTALEGLPQERTALVGQQVKDHIAYRLLLTGVLDLGRLAELMTGQDGFQIGQPVGEEDQLAV